MARRLADRALLLRRFPYGESSLVVHAFTRSHGRVHLLAKGAYRATSRFAWTLDLFDDLELEWAAPRGAHLGLLAAARIARRRRNVPADLARYRAALAALELVDLCAREGQAEPELFALTRGLLDRLEAGAAAPDLELCAFDLGALARLGLAPALQSCAACGRGDSRSPGAARARAGSRAGGPGTGGPGTGSQGTGKNPGPGLAIGNRAFFSAAAGGRLCEDCAAEARASGDRVGTLPIDVLRVAHHLLVDAPESTARLRLTEDQRERLKRFVREFLEHHLESARRTRHAPSLAPPLRPA